MNKISAFQLSAYDTPYEDETDEIMQTNFPIADVIYLRDSAVKLNLSCLSGISELSKTFFNQKQALEIKERELSQLIHDKSMNKNLLKRIEEIATLVLSEGYQFLKFEPRI